jgi:hypothetical protein
VTTARTLAALLLASALLSACGGGSTPPDPRRQKYDSDKAGCEAVSADKGAQKSCMTYRGWPEGKFR